MKFKQHNQSGFTGVEGLLIILILAVIGFGGYYVWHSQHKAKNNQPTITSSTAKSQSLSVSATRQLLSSFYAQYITAVNSGVGNTTKQLVEQYGTTNLVNYAYPSSGSYAEDPIICAQDTPTGFNISSVTSNSTNAAGSIIETYGSTNVKVSATVVSQSGNLKIDTITCSPALVSSQVSN